MQLMKNQTQIGAKKLADLTKLLWSLMHKEGYRYPHLSLPLISMRVML
jgi:hypothetical protein